MFLEEKAWSIFMALGNEQNSAQKSFGYLRKMFPEIAMFGYYKIG